MLPKMIKDRVPPPSQKTENGDRLWEIVTKDVRKLKHAEIVPAKGTVSKAKKTPLKSAKIVSAPPVVASKPVKQIAAKSGGPDGKIDRKTDDKIRKGDMEIEGKLDLHGNTAAAARKKLLTYIVKSHAQGKRCVLLVTGKGQSGPDKTEWYESGKGIIRREFRLWLEDASVRGLIMSVTEAQARHGGSGAFYIYLRKNRF